MILTEQQEKAISISKRAYFNSEPLTIIAGYAGTGKTVVVTKIIESLNLRMDQVAFVTFTGKAALVLQQRGIPAKTIHKIFYQVYTDKDGKMTCRPKRQLDEDYALIVIDEVSMVSMDLFKTIRRHGIPIIALGDPGQLPPVGEDNKLLERPHIFLDQVMRQAKENPIIQLSMDIREGKPLILQKNDKVQVLPKKEVVDGMFTWADQILCGKNVTRTDLNRQVRESIGRKSYWEPEVEDKVIILKNYWDKLSDGGLPLVNGMTGNIKRIRDKTSKNLYCDFQTDFSDDRFNNIMADLCTITGEERGNHKKQKNNPLIEFDYGYAITVWKSQGSQWNNVLFFAEQVGNMGPEGYKKLLYTAATRAVDKLVIIKP